MNNNIFFFMKASLFSVYHLPSSSQKFFNQIKDALSFPIKNHKALTGIINNFFNILNPDIELHKDFSNLEKAVNYLSSQYEDFDFFEKILPSIAKSCLDIEILFKESNQTIILLEKNQEGEVEFSSAQIRSILANGFFNTLEVPTSQLLKNSPAVRKFGNLSFYRLYRGLFLESIERLKCLLFYFYLTEKSPPSETVKFIRVCKKEYEFLEKLDKELELCSVNIYSDKEYETKAFFNVDFANKNLQIHRIIPSLTQEEVLFTLHPALYVSLLLSETMGDNEAIIMLGCKKYIASSGYLETFQFEGQAKNFNQNKKNDLIQGIIAIDALCYDNPYMQFRKKCYDRDINKAYIGFSALDSKKIQNTILDANLISTGNWGCGVFGGNKHLKFIQQLIAASLAGKRLDYSTFGDEELAKDFRNIYQRIKELSLSVKDLYGIIEKFSKVATTIDQFDLYIKNFIKLE